MKELGIKIIKLIKEIVVTTWKLALLAFRSLKF